MRRTIYPWPKDIFTYLRDLWGVYYLLGLEVPSAHAYMRSLSYWDARRLTYDAANDELINAKDWTQ